MLSLRPPLSSAMRKLIAVAVSCFLCLFLYHSWSITSNFYQPVQLFPPTSIPKRIWYKLGPKGLSDDARNWTDSCAPKNPGYEATFLTDETSDAWVREAYASRPDIVESYLALSVPILKADFLRYLLLFAEGGIWSDLDVSCEDIPIDDWIPPEYKEDAGLVVGWEFDVGWGRNVMHQLNSWMILARPGLPYMMQAIEDILQSLHDVAANNHVAISDVKLSMVGDVVDFTGPRRLTRSVFKGLQQTLNSTDAEFKPIEQSTWFITEPKLVADVLVLPGFSFAYSMNKYEELEDVVVGPPLVKHHYAGSWKNEHGGEAV